MVNGKEGGVRRLTLVWKDGTWHVDGEDVVDAALPPATQQEEASPAPFYWELVAPGGELIYSHADQDPRVAYYDHLTDEGELEGGRFTDDFAVVDVLVPDRPGAELRVHAAAPEAPAAPDRPGPRGPKNVPGIALRHRIGGHRG